MEEIPPELIFNWDQTGIHLIPVSPWTIEQTGATRVEIGGVDNKHQITAICGTLTGDFLPLQIIYKGKMECCHPKFTFPCEWNVTHSPNHWSTEATMIEYVEEIINLYVEATRDLLNDPAKAALAIIDKFRGQITTAVVTLLERNNIHICYIPANMTNLLQPMVLAINKPAKDFLKRKFEL